MCEKKACGLDFEVIYLGESATELPIKGAVAFAIRQAGDVPALIEGGLKIGDECESREFPQVDGMEYLRNKELKWDPVTGGGTNYSLELVILRKIPNPDFEEPAQIEA